MQDNKINMQFCYVSMNNIYNHIDKQETNLKTSNTVHIPVWIQQFFKSTCDLVMLTFNLCLWYRTIILQYLFASM